MKEKKTNEYSIASEAALQAYLEEEKLDEYYTRELAISMIGAGCGRTDWVERGGVFDERMCFAAATGGQLRVLKWLRGQNCSWDSMTCSGAAMNGHLELLQWARGEGCKWNSDTCYEAARGGHMEVLKWAINNGCPYHEEDFEEISDPDFHEWFGEYKDSGPWGWFTCMVAASNGHLDVLKWAM